MSDVYGFVGLLLVIGSVVYVIKAIGEANNEQQVKFFLLAVLSAVLGNIAQVLARMV